MKPTTITRSQYEAAYKLGVKKHKGAVGISEAIAELQTIGLNRSSAADLVYNAAHLISGRRYTRTLSVPATDDYLLWIARDFKSEGLSRAVSALKQHIDYYEALEEVRLHAHREVLKKYESRLAQVSVAPSEPTLDVEWRDQASRGWFDSLPLRWFGKEGVMLGEEHEVAAMNGDEKASARCDVTVSANVAELNYENHPKFNNGQGMYLGVARIHFADSDRTRIAKLEWRPAGKTAFTAHHFRVLNLKVPDEAEYQPPTKKAAKRAVMVRERPGQAAFRKKLKGAYNHTCCISGCEVSDALEGAHIDPFVSKASDNLRNGLLLRRDIHTIYDRDLVAIEPGTHIVHVSASIRTTTGYASFHGKTIKLPENPTHRPCQAALERRWKRFLQKHA